MILLTGCNSYLGKKLLERLVAMDENVRCIDYYKPENLPSSVEFMQADLLDESALKKACNGIDSVFHFLDIKYSGSRGRRYMKNFNIKGTEKILKAAEKEGVKKFFFLSSYTVYGKKKEIPIRQDDIKRPVSSYGKDKLKCENLCWRFAEKSKMSVTIFRPALVSGSGVKDQIILTSLYMALAMEDESRLYIMGNGDTKFQLLHPDDAVEAFILALNSDISRSKAYNLGADNVHTQIEQIVKMKEESKLDCPIIHVTPFKTLLWSVIFKPLKLNLFTKDHRFYLSNNLLLDCQLIKNDLGWVPQKDNLEIMKETIDWYLNRIM